MDYLALSNEHTFLVGDHDGDVRPDDRGLGLYRDDTRYLSEIRLLLNGKPLSLLMASDDDVYRTTSLLTNEGFETPDGERVWPQTISVSRDRVVSQAVTERIALTNHNRFPIAVDLSLRLASDFADIFQVRGFEISTEGQYEAPRRQDGSLRLAYRGADGVLRFTDVRCSIPPDEVSTGLPEAGSRSRRLGGTGEESDLPARTPAQEEFVLREPVRAELSWRLDLQPQSQVSLELRYEPGVGDAGGEQAGEPMSYEATVRSMADSYSDWTSGSTVVRSDDEGFNSLLERSALDLRALVGTYPTGRLPVAGIPWYAVPFGRDSLITSLQTLCFRPELAKGTLRFLARHQGTQDDPWRDEEPGKILHEMRFGELAGMGAVPHTPYYGSVDSTPLFVMLFAQTLRWTGDRQLYEELMPNVLRALEWMDRHGDLDGDGYLEFRSRSDMGIRNQGWKDSGNSLLYPDGKAVEPPVALVEVQAYAHAAKSWLAGVVRHMGDSELAGRLEGEAEALRARFNRDFWLEREGYYTQALDGEKRPVEDLTSNPGHALMCDILPEDRADRVVERLVAPDLASGWGVRTRGASDPNYNPMSYHNGSVWPHDNSLIIYGMARSGYREEANRLAGEVFAVARHYRLVRLPELMCGFSPDETGGRPAEYPVSCSPQSWAAGTAWLILQSILGLEADALSNTLRIDPRLPDWLSSVEVQNLRVGESQVHLRAHRTGVEVVSSGDVRVHTD